MGSNVLRERARIKIIRLRQLASLSEKKEYEPRRLFKEIEQDPRCNQIFHNSYVVVEDEKIVEYYNEHIRQSSLSKRNKQRLLI